MRSVMSVKQVLTRSTNLVDYYVVTITETWLNAGHKDNEFISSKYRVYRKDRCFSSIGTDKGGGVLIAVKSDIDCEQFASDEMTDLEAVCVRFPLDKGNLFIYCLYIQPCADKEMYEAHINAIVGLQSRISIHDTLVIAGDFNLPTVQLLGFLANHW